MVIAFGGGGGGASYIIANAILSFHVNLLKIFSYLCTRVFPKAWRCFTLHRIAMYHRNRVDSFAFGSSEPAQETAISKTRVCARGRKVRSENGHHRPPGSRSSIGTDSVDLCMDRDYRVAADERG